MENMRDEQMMIMFIVSFFIHYFFMSLLMADSIENIMNSIGKYYLAVIISITMLLTEIVMSNGKHSDMNIVMWSTMLVIFIILYRNQVLVDDKQYLREMIEHHSMAILTSDEIRKKSKNRKILEISNRILKTQKHEINEMKELLKNIKKEHSF